MMAVSRWADIPSSDSNSFLSTNRRFCHQYTGVYSSDVLSAKIPTCFKSCSQGIQRTAENATLFTETILAEDSANFNDTSFLNHTKLIDDSNTSLNALLQKVSITDTNRLSAAPKPFLNAYHPLIGTQDTGTAFVHRSNSFREYNGSSGAGFRYPSRFYRSKPNEKCVWKKEAKLWNDHEAKLSDNTILPELSANETGANLLSSSRVQPCQRSNPKNYNLEKINATLNEAHSSFHSNLKKNFDTQNLSNECRTHKIFGNRKRIVCGDYKENISVSSSVEPNKQLVHPDIGINTQTVSDGNLKKQKKPGYAIFGTDVECDIFGDIKFQSTNDINCNQKQPKNNTAPKISSKSNFPDGINLCDNGTSAPNLKSLNNTTLENDSSVSSTLKTAMYLQEQNNQLQKMLLLERNNNNLWGDFLFLQKSEKINIYSEKKGVHQDGTKKTTEPEECNNSLSASQIRRLKDISLGKASKGYQNMIKTLQNPVLSKKILRPKTPDPYDKSISNLKFMQQVSSWKQALHEFDNYV